MRRVAGNKFPASWREEEMALEGKERVLAGPVGQH